jgi:acetyltransferase-like isoleucine patch superfamily enzyme
MLLNEAIFHNRNIKIEILGYGKAKVCLIYDILQLLIEIDCLNVFLNMDTDTGKMMYTKDFPINFFPPGVIPGKESKFAFGTSNPSIKLAIFNYFNKLSGISQDDFISIVHPGSQISRSSIVDNGCLIDSLVSISAQSKIEFGVDIKRGAQIGHHNKIGQFADINPGAILCGNVTVGHQSVIGAGAIIKDGVNIGPHTIIGMGSVVTSDIPGGVIAYGSPCKVIKYI